MVVYLVAAHGPESDRQVAPLFPGLTDRGRLLQPRRGRVGFLIGCFDGTKIIVSVFHIWSELQLMIISTDPCDHRIGPYRSLACSVAQHIHAFRADSRDIYQSTLIIAGCLESAERHREERLYPDLRVKSIQPCP